MPDGFQMLSLAAASLCCALVPAQTAWTYVRTPPTRPSMTLDEVRRCVVLDGQSIPSTSRASTWEWDHGDWRSCASATMPLSTTTAITYDRDRHRVVRVAGALSGPVFLETWTYDGTAWTNVHPAVQPSPRMYFPLAYDVARQRAVLFGGFGPNGLTYADTWEFDGTTWAQRATPVAPPGRLRSAMAYDETRQECVVFGGMPTVLTQIGDTWLLGATGWRQATPATTPPPRADHAMAFDRTGQQVVMFGGQTNDTWLWNGSDWTLATPAQAPASRALPAIATDPSGGVLLYGGEFQRSDLWHFGQGEWVRFHGDLVIREQSGRNWMTFDTARRRLVWVGDGFNSGASETWEHDGRYWTDVSAAGARPASRYGAAIAFDAARGVTMLFGGEISLGTTDDAWTWDGAAWTQWTPAVRPPARESHGLAYDPSSQRVVLFGGVTSAFSAGVELGDTWLWNGAAWQQDTSTPSPTPRHYITLATDPIRNRALLFGGRNGTVPNVQNDETWAYASGWTQLHPPVRPSARSHYVMAFDPHRDRLVLQGGWLGTTVAHDTWEFDGTTWAQLPMATVAGTSEVLVYDGNLDAIWSKGGLGNQSWSDYMLLAREPGAASVSYGTWCGQSGPPPRLVAGSAPYFGNHAFQVEVQGQANAISLLVLGLQAGSTPVQNCTLLVAPPFGMRATIANAYGFAAFAQQVPVLPALQGIHLFFQAAQYEAAIGMFGFSAGLDLMLGR